MHSGRLLAPPISLRFSLQTYTTSFQISHSHLLNHRFFIRIASLNRLQLYFCSLSGAVHLIYYTSYVRFTRVLFVVCSLDNISFTLSLLIDLMSLQCLQSFLSVTSSLLQGYSLISTDSLLSHPRDVSAHAHLSHIWKIAVIVTKTRQDGLPDL